MKGGQLRTLLITGSLLLAIALYFAPSQLKGKKEVPAAATTGSGDAFSPEALLQTAKSSLDSTERKNLEFFEESLKKNGERDTVLLDGIGRLWDRNGIPAAAAIWFERKAAVLQNEQSYLEAAYRYFDAFRIAKDTSVRSVLVAKAISNYQKVLEKNPGNLNAKTDLGACYADGTSEPMKGIMLLREVVTENPNHEMAQYNLGMLSVKSGQLDKAVERFQKVLEINPGRNEMHFFLGQVFLQKGDTASALRNYETFIKNANYDVSDVIKLVEDLKKRPS